MNRKPQSRFDPSSTQVRTLCAAAAIAATIASLGFIDALAHVYDASAPVMANAAPVVVAED